MTAHFRSLTVLPDDGILPILDSIESASQSIDIKMFAFSEPHIEKAVTTAHQKGVRVRIMLNPARRSGFSDNGEVFQRFLNAGIPVKDTNPEFVISHEKSMIVDQRIALIHSFNWTTDNIAKRDYAITTTWQDEVNRILACFEADWNRNPFNPDDHAALVWCRGNGRKVIGEFIDQADRKLWIQNERYDDETILEHLVRAKSRGVKIHLLASYPHKLKAKKFLSGIASLRILQDIGIKIHHLKGIPLHAKMMLADDRRAIVGSINFSAGSFDDRRELAIVVDEAPVIARLKSVFHHDWKHSSRIDLSNQGILKNLEHHHRADLEPILLRQEIQSKR